jgi:DNA-binding FadR family transcriptional regulator
VLGSETDLLERYDVSRAVFREAVRLVEHQQVARTRRDPGGGLVITEPTVDAVIDAVVVCLHRVDAQLDEVFEARIVLEEIASELAPGRANERDLESLRLFANGSDTSTAEDPRTPTPVAHCVRDVCARRVALAVRVVGRHGPSHRAGLQSKRTVGQASPLDVVGD